MATTYTSILKKLREEHKERLAMLEQYKEALLLTNKYAAIFSEAKAYTEGRYSYVNYVTLYAFGPLSLTLYPAKGENVSVAFPVIDAMIRDEKLEMVVPLEKKVDPYTGRVRASFALRDNKVGFSVYIDMARSCKQVGTGRYEEVKEYTCNDL